MIASKGEARHVIEHSKDSGDSVTQALQYLNSKGRKYNKLERLLLRSRFTQAEATTELSTAGITP